jgi:hypothetical protein
MIFLISIAVVANSHCQACAHSPTIDVEGLAHTACHAEVDHRLHIVLKMRIEVHVVVDGEVAAFAVATVVKNHHVVAIGAELVHLAQVIGHVAFSVVAHQDQLRGFGPVEGKYQALRVAPSEVVTSSSHKSCCTCLEVACTPVMDSMRRRQSHSPL